MSDRPLPGQSINLPMASDLATTFGYPGNARYVGFRVDSEMDDLIFDDGVSGGNGATWVFMSYRRHRAVGTLLDDVGIGLTEPRAENWLLIDTEAGRASIVPVNEARQFLRDQYPEQPPLTPEQIAAVQGRMDAMLAEGWREERVDPEAVMKAMAEQRARVGRMLSWLDMAPVPPPKEGRGA